MKPHRLEHVLALALDHPWALTEDRLRMVAMILSRHLAGVEATEPFARADRADVTTAAGGIAILPIHGVIAPRMTMLSDFSGGTTFEQAEAQLRAAVADRSIDTIILDINSPGGSVARATEYSRAVGEAAAVKRVIAHANTDMCSAAYWAACRATEITATPSALVGSVGVYSLHEDLSRALDALGITHTYVSDGEFKVEGNPSEPLSPAAKEYMTAIVQHFGRQFHTDIAEGRHVSVETVRATYGKGRPLTADAALAAGVIDRIETMDQTLARARTLPPLGPRAERTHYEQAITREILQLGI